MASITSASAIFMLAVPDVFPVAQRIQEFSVDDAFTQTSFQLSEARMGVDGKSAGGYTPSLKPLEVFLMANSPSVQTFDDWISAIEAANETFPATATIDIPAIGKSYSFNVGWLKDVKRLPDAKKVLEQYTYTIMWESISVVPI